MSDFILHNVNGLSIGLRQLDGYVNATRLTQAYKEQTGKRRDVANWLENKRTQEMLKHLSSVTVIPVNQLYQVVQGGVPENQGTWIHPLLLDSYLAFLNKSRNSSPSHLYVIGDKTRNVCKIGIASDVYKRLKRIQSTYPWELDIWLEIRVKEPRKIEKELHQRFTEFQLNGEWFDAAVFDLIDLNLLK